MNGMPLVGPEGVFVVVGAGVCGAGGVPGDDSLGPAVIFATSSQGMTFCSPAMMTTTFFPGSMETSVPRFVSPFLSWISLFSRAPACAASSA